MTTTLTTAELEHAAGRELGATAWHAIDQERVNLFAEATGDRQWIHVDPERAARELPGKTTIAHGFLTLSLVSALAGRAMAFPGVQMAVNYGMNRLRFVSPVPAGSRIRARFSPLAVLSLAGGGLQVTWKVVVEREGGERPCCVAEWLVRYHERPSGS